MKSVYAVIIAVLIAYAAPSLADGINQPCVDVPPGISVSKYGVLYACWEVRLEMACRKSSGALFCGCRAGFGKVVNSPQCEGLRSYYDDGNLRGRNPRAVSRNAGGRPVAWNHPASNCYGKYGYGPIVFNEDTQKEHSEWVADLDPVCRSRYESYGSGR